MEGRRTKTGRDQHLTGGALVTELRRLVVDPHDVTKGPDSVIQYNTKWKKRIMDQTETHIINGKVNVA